jgi:ApaG protein
MLFFTPFRLWKRGFFNGLLMAWNQRDHFVAMTDTTQNRIDVDVKTAYLDEQSDPAKDQYAFSYTITIRNAGTVAARLLTRHWVITDSNGKVQEVRGEGVVGEQPSLQPGEDFRYTSGTLLETPVGSMEGSYGMISEDGQAFDARIQPFSLAIPRSLH